MEAYPDGLRMKEETMKKGQMIDLICIGIVFLPGIHEV